MNFDIHHAGPHGHFEGIRATCRSAAASLAVIVSFSSVGLALAAEHRLAPGPGTAPAPADMQASGSAPPFTAHIDRIGPEIGNNMLSRSMHPGCPVPLDELRHIRLSHWDMDGKLREGELIVHASVAREVVDIFRAIYNSRFPIARMRLIDSYEGDDDRSMRDNNTSAFNCRRRTGGGRQMSMHSYGLAIDINPLQNPYVKEETIRPQEAAAFRDRRRQAPGMIQPGDAVHRAFVAHGWHWGGDWTHSKDYQHFEKTLAE